MPNLTMMQWQWVTFSAILAITAFVILFDIFVIQAGGVDASISRVLRRIFSAYPTVFAAILFWLGVWVGHTWLSTE